MYLKLMILVTIFGLFIRRARREGERESERDRNRE